MRRKDPVKQVLDPLRKGLYCLALYAALKFVWLAPVNQSLETTDWWGMLRQLLTQF